MKHAFLIIAHNEPEVLEELIKRLNHPDIKLFIHVDKKAKFNVENLILNHSNKNVSFIKSRKTFWGSYSLIAITLELLKTAYKEKFDYYHLISGTTLPIKSINEILEFYNKNVGKEFVEYFKNYEPIYKRYSHYYFLPYTKNIITRAINKLFYIIPRKVFNKDKNFYKKSSEWFSITNDFCSYLLAREQWIKDNFKYTIACDEVFLGTILYNSIFYKNCYLSNMNYIDWDDVFASGQHLPATLNFKYLNILKSSDKLFARKFDSSFKDFYYKLFE